MLLALSAGGFRLWRITRRATLLQPGKIRIYGLNMQGSAFTFFNRIYINELGTKPQDIAQIVAHETHHARLRHSWDILLSSVLRDFLFWWNPVVWLWERSLREVHEFQADDAVLNNGFDSEQYIALILGGLTVIRPEFVSGFCLFTHQKTPYHDRSKQTKTPVEIQNFAGITANRAPDGLLFLYRTPGTAIRTYGDRRHRTTVLSEQRGKPPEVIRRATNVLFLRNRDEWRKCDRTDLPRAAAFDSR